MSSKKNLQCYPLSKGKRMPDKSLMTVAGAQTEKPSKYTPIATLKWIGGLQTQRSPFASLDTRLTT
jgi:hypothetical protein